jgi:L-alanine-DL-glutamate epimerase-like enolase superfamily enzyme
MRLMRDSDIRVVGAATEFADVTLENAFNIAGGAISGFSVAYVTVDVVDRRGRRSRGRGASVLSVPWSWPNSRLSLNERDTRLREIVIDLAESAPDLDCGDPFQLWRLLSARLEDLLQDTSEAEVVPALAGDLALGALDNALHDAWAAAAQKPVFSMYNETYLNEDLSSSLGNDFQTRWPGEYLVETRRCLPIQHVVGVGDPLVTSGSSEAVSLHDWVHQDRFHHAKIKLDGTSPRADAQRVRDVHAVMREVVGDSVLLAIDPNEGYESIDGLDEMVDRLRTDAPVVAASVEYIEQPVPRTDIPPALTMTKVGSSIPILMDEGLSRIEQLADIADDGWQGLAVKASKGQSLAMLCQAFARHHGMFLTVQDLTAVDLALEHSARLASNVGVSATGFEYNSRQYAPTANVSLAAARPELVLVVDGSVEVGAQTRPGLY